MIFTEAFFSQSLLCLQVLYFWNKEIYGLQNSISVFLDFTCCSTAISWFCVYITHSACHQLHKIVNSCHNRKMLNEKYNSIQETADAYTEIAELSTCEKLLSHDLITIRMFQYLGIICLPEKWQRYTLTVIII